MPLATLPGRGPITTHLEGPHSHEKCHKVKVIVHTNPRYQTPMRPRQRHSCASQRHPDTMHNTQRRHPSCLVAVLPHNRVRGVQWLSSTIYCSLRLDLGVDGTQPTDPSVVILLSMMAWPFPELGSHPAEALDHTWRSKGEENGWSPGTARCEVEVGK